MAAGDTVFGDHEELIARVPQLLESTERAIQAAIQARNADEKQNEAANTPHPMVLAARFHGFYEYLHPFRDGNGRTGRLISNYILLRLGHPLLVIPSGCRNEYFSALRMIRTEATDEHLIHFFFKMATDRWQPTGWNKKSNKRKLTPIVLGHFFSKEKRHQQI